MVLLTNMEVDKDDEIETLLLSGELSTRISAIERTAANPTRYAKRVVSLIEKFPADAYFILEQIWRFGDEAIPHLRALMESTKTNEVRVACTLGLAHFRQEVDLEVLTDPIRAKSDYQHLACKALRWLKARSTLPILIDQLSSTPLNDEWRIVSLVHTILDLGGQLPEAEIDRLHSPRAPWEIKTLFKEYRIT